MRLLLPAVVAAILLAAAPAGAASIALQYVQTEPEIRDGKYGMGRAATDVYALRVVDADGAANRIAVDGAGRVRDAAEPLALGEGCAADGEGWVTCVPPGPHASRQVLSIDAGAGDDQLTLGTTFATGPGSVDLGPGDDRVEAAGGWRIAGGPGADALRAGQPGASPLVVADDCGGGCAVWDGGPGPDSSSGNLVVASYAGRAAPVRVTPDGVADDGEADEGDDVGGDVAAIVGGDGADALLASTGGVSGGPGDDVILGSERPAAHGLPVLSGGPGNDTILGGSGAEELSGGIGDDVLDGGAGNDLLRPDAGADHVRGGAGDDRFDDQPDGAPDVLDGGPGTDALSALYAEHPVRITLGGGADDGEPGEHDDMTGWEDVSISTGRIVGTDGPEALSVARSGSIDGRGGDDRLRGSADIVGGPGRDVIVTGSDPFPRHERRVFRIDTRDGDADRVECFDRSVILRADARDRRLGCAGHPEVTLAPTAAARPIALHDGTVVALLLRCFSGQVCHGRIWLRAGRAGSRPVATRTFSTAGEGHPLLRVHRRADGRGPCGTLRATVRLDPDAGGHRVQHLVLGRCAWG